jgi:hypothetical protein
MKQTKFLPFWSLQTIQWVEVKMTDVLESGKCYTEKQQERVMGVGQGVMMLR